MVLLFYKLKDLKREFLINITFLILINVLIKPLYIFFIDAKVQDTLGLETYGLYFGVFNFAYILYIITDFGIQNYNSKTISQNRELIKEYLPNILGIKVLLSLVYLIIGIAIAFIIGYSPFMIKLFVAIAVNLILLSFILYLRSNISALGKYRWDSILSSLDKLILIFILGFILYFSNFEFELKYFIFAQTLAFFIVFTIVLSINFHLTKIRSIKFSSKFFKKILKKSLPYSLVFLLMTLYMKMDGFMLERMLDSPVEAGIYAEAFRLYEAFNNIGYLFAVLLLPMFASLLDKNNKLKNLVFTSHNIMLFIAVSAVAIVALYREEIMIFLYPKEYNSYHSIILVVLMLSFFAISLTYIYGTLLTATGKITIFNKIVFLGVIINLVLNLILIPQKGAFGAAIATVFTQYFVLIGQYFYSLKYFDLGFDFVLFFKRIVYLITTILLLYFIKSYFSYNPWLMMLISGLFSMIIAIFSGLIKFSDLKR